MSASILSYLPPQPESVSAGAFLTRLVLALGGA